MTNVSPNAIAGTWARSAVAVFFGIGLASPGGRSGRREQRQRRSLAGRGILPAVEAFQKSVPDLNKSIQDSAGTIDSMNDVEKARAEIDKLREWVQALLGAVSDNGPVSQLGAKALNHVHDKLKALAQETRFKQEERQFLIDQWRRLQDQTESATNLYPGGRGFATASSGEVAG